MTNQALVRKTMTRAIIFIGGKPNPEELKRVKNSGATFKNGHWYETATEEFLGDREAGLKNYGV